ncbi:MAG: hypothetical protein ACLQU4_11185, partial [Limisphaerales bacterium]
MKDGPDKHNPTKKELRPADYVNIFKKALASYGKEHPHWHIEVLVSLIKWGLLNLRRCIEQKRNSKITWDNPFLELHYPVKWDWKSRREGDKVQGKEILGKFTRQNTSDIAKGTKTLSQMMTYRIYTMALGLFTNHARFEKRGKAYVPYLENEINSLISQIQDKAAKQETVEELFRPFSIGAERIDVSSVDSKKGDRLARNLSRPIEPIGQRMDIPGIAFSGEVNGRKIWAGVIFEIQPLIVDYDTKRAYYPITIGIAFEHRLVGNDLVSLRRTPSFRPRSTENKRDFYGLLSLLFLVVCRSFRVSKPFRK